MANISRVALILMTPWYHVWNLQMPVRQRISVCGIFMLGGFVIATGIVRLTALRQALAPSNDHSCTFPSGNYFLDLLKNVKQTPEAQFSTGT